MYYLFTLGLCQMEAKVKRVGEVLGALGILTFYLGLMCYLRARGVKELPEGEE